MTCAKSANAGYTLVETLVAFVILSGTIVLALSAMTDGLHRMQHAASVVQASEVARLVLSTATDPNKQLPLAREGELNGLKWRLEAVALSTAESGAASPTLVRITIFDRTGQPVPRTDLESILMLQPQ